MGTEPVSTVDAAETQPVLAVTVPESSTSTQQSQPQLSAAYMDTPEKGTFLYFLTFKTLPLLLFFNVFRVKATSCHGISLTVKVCGVALYTVQ